MAEKKKQDAKSKNQVQMRQLAAWLPAITGIIFVGYAAAAWFLLFVPKIGTLMPGGKYDFSSQEARIAEDEAYIVKVDNALTSFREIEPSDRKKVQQMTPSDGLHFPSLMTQMERISEAHGLQMSVIDAQSSDSLLSPAGRRPTRIVTSFEGGNYRAFRLMLNDIEKSVRIMDIAQMIASEGSESFQVVMDVYDLADADAMPAVAN